MSDKIGDPPLNGNFFNVIKPLGWVAIILFIIGTAIIMILRKNLKKEAMMTIDQDKPKPDYKAM